MNGNYRFFRNENCHYFPCHATKNDQEFSCQFCYCPLYLFPDCGGNPVQRGQVKDCSLCDKPHRPDGYDHVVARLGRYFEELCAEPPCPGRPDTPEVGAFCWNELLTTDCEGQGRFYRELLGWTVEPSGPRHYLVAKSKGRPVAGISVLPEAGPERPMWTASVRVADAVAAGARAESLGGRLLVPARDIPGLGRFCVIADPQGALLCLMSYFGTGAHGGDAVSGR